MTLCAPYLLYVRPDRPVNATVTQVMIRNGAEGAKQA
jgi:hypothetical protein